MNSPLKRGLVRGLIVVVLLVGAVGIAAMLGKMKPPPERRQVEKLAPLVDILTVREETVSFTVRSQGTVRPRNETILSAEVAGAIESLSPKFVAGGVFEAGEELLRIDPTNYEVALEQAEALVSQRQIEFDGAERLRNQGYRAESEWASAKAALASANAELVRARRNLERTRVALPYDGMVRSREADLGQYVSPGSRLGTTFSTGVVEIRLPLTDNDLAFLDLPDPAAASAGGFEGGPSVNLWAEQRGKRESWTGRIIRTEGVIDETTRVTYVVAVVNDPYLRSPHNAGRAPLPVGTFVGAEIDGRSVDGIVPVPRSALRGNGQIIVVNEESRLEIRNVDILRADTKTAYLRSGVADGERISLTIIENPINGMQVRARGDGDDNVAAGLSGAQE